MTLPPGIDEDHRPSVKFVAHVLEDAGPLSREELVERTGMGESTVKRALNDLTEAGIIAQTRESGDLRKVQYQSDTER